MTERPVRGRPGRASTNLTVRLVEHLLDRRRDLHDLHIAFIGSTATDGGIAFQFHSPEGEHTVELQHREWAARSPEVLASAAAREAIREWQSRRRQRRREG